MLFDGIDAKRSVEPGDPAVGPQNSIYIYRPPVAGVHVDDDAALTYSAVWACTRIISETIAMLPWHVFRNIDDGKEVDRNHRVDGILSRRPNDETIPFTFKETMIAHAVTCGNGYAEIEKSRGGDVAAMWTLTPDRVNPDRDSRGRLVYDIAQSAGANITLNPDKIFHLKGLGFDGTTGYSVVQKARESISLGLATNHYGASFFGNGAIPGGVITQKPGEAKNLDAKGIKNLLRTWNSKNRGANKAHKVEFLDAGLEFEAIGIKPEEAQFLESMKFQINDICRWFRMPPHKLADLTRSTHNNIESQNIEFVVDTILPWAIRLEQEANFKLFPTSDYRHFTKLNLMSLLRGDSKSRAEFYKIMLDHGVYDIDEVRALEDLNKLSGGRGKLRMVQLNMSSVENAIKNGGTGQAREAGRGQQAVASTTARRMVKLEINRLQSVISKDYAQQDIEKFYRQYTEQLCDALQPVAIVTAETFGIEGDLKPIIEQFVSDWVSDAMTELLSTDDPDQLLTAWNKNRAHLLAECLLGNLLLECKKHA